MKKTGYKWNADKKELKKFDFSKPIKYNSNPPSIIKESDWSEEDEHKIKLLEALCEDKLCESVPNSTMYEEMKITIDWINSIKERIIE